MKINTKKIRRTFRWRILARNMNTGNTIHSDNYLHPRIDRVLSFGSEGWGNSPIGCYIFFYSNIYAGGPMIWQFGVSKEFLEKMINDV